MPWHARLQLAYTRESARTIARFEHEGPLRILQSLYPEGDGICHNVLVHPPGGLVGGDTLAIDIRVGPQSHALLTTPGAARYYRSEGAIARQQTRIQLETGARIEWLPLEAICYSGCKAENHLRMEIEPGAELIGWDCTALGLPAADKAFERGSFLQHIELDGAWLERGLIDAQDDRLMRSPLGLAGQHCLASLFFCTGSALTRARQEQALNAARAVMQAHALSEWSGATCPNDRVVVVRVLAPLVEPTMALLRQVRAAWRDALWQLAPVAPRIWST